MKQPIITRDLERKAIYTDILYDPEWTYVEAYISEAYVSSETYFIYSLNAHDCDNDFVIDWGDGCIEKNMISHTYEQAGMYTIRLKGSIMYKGNIDPQLHPGLFDERCTINAL